MLAELAVPEGGPTLLRRSISGPLFRLEARKEGRSEVSSGPATLREMGEPSRPAFEGW